MSPARILLATAALTLTAALPATQQRPKEPRQTEKAPEPTFDDGKAPAPGPDATKATAPDARGRKAPNAASPTVDIDKVGGGTSAAGEDRTLEALMDDEPQPPAARGILGASLFTDALALVLAVLLGALLGGWLGAWRAAGLAKGEFAGLRGRIAAVERGLNAQAKLSQPAAAPPPPPRRQSLYGGPAAYGLGPDETDFQPAPAARGDMRPAADSGLRAAENERRKKLNQAVEDYCRLVATKGARPRQFEEQLAAFPKLLSVRSDSGNLIGEPYREGDANQIVVAAGDGEHFAMLPTYEYVSNFSMAFSKLVSTPPIVSQLFDLDEDESGQLRLIRPATVEMEDSSVLRLSGKGRLSGFRS